MSFAAEVKKELTQIEVDNCCARAELSALVRMNGTIQLANKRMGVDVITENAAIARRIFSLVKKLYHFNCELLVRKKMRLKKNNVYIVRLSVDVQHILKDLKILEDGFDFVAGIAPELMHDECCKSSYLRGAFLAGGSVNNPESSSYHLEIFSMYKEHSDDICKLANEFHANAKVIERKKGYVMYIKEGERITEFLSLIGAHRALFKFEDVRIVKDMRNSVNRLVNCETANLNKTIAASMRQIENIKLIERNMGIDQLPPRLRDVAVMRLQHPDINLTELGEMLPGKVSKSGINHRLRKLDEIAERIRANG